MGVNIVGPIGKVYLQMRPGAGLTTVLEALRVASISRLGFHLQHRLERPTA
jgi:hypothetical protein